MQRADRLAKGGEAALEGFDVLAGQHGRGGGDGHLPAFQHGDGGGAQRDLGLAIAHVADHQPVHRFPRGEIVAHRLDGAGLIGGFGEGEARREAFVIGGIAFQHRGRLPLAGLGQFRQGLRGFRHRRLDLVPALAPARPVQAVQRHRLGLGPVAPDAVRLKDGDQPHAVRRIGQADRLAGVALAQVGQGLDARHDADAVVLVDHHVADADAHLVQQRLARGHGILAQGTAAQQVGGGDGQDTVAPEAALGGHG